MQVLVSRFRLCQSEFRFVDIRPQDRASGGDHPGYIESYVTAATPSLPTHHSGPYSGALQKRDRARAHHPRQKPQAFPTLNSTANDVVCGPGHAVR